MECVYKYDRDVNQVGYFDSGPKPKIWRVYMRKKGKGGKGIRNDDVAI